MTTESHPTVPHPAEGPQTAPEQVLPTAPQAAPQTAPEASPLAGPQQPPARPLPRTGPIVWGALILVFCGYIAQRAFGAGPLDGSAWVIASMLGVGAILLAVGTAVIIRNRRR